MNLVSGLCLGLTSREGVSELSSNFESHGVHGYKSQEGSDENQRDCSTRRVPALSLFSTHS